MPRGRARPAPAPFDVVELTRQLGGLLAEMGLGEIEVAVGDLRVRVARPAVATAAGAGSVPGGAGPAPTIAGYEPGPAGSITVESPMVGTFYRAASPTSEPYVREGELIKEGQILCIIEAMKLMNEIESKAAGRISRVLVDNAQAVEYGQPLFIIEPVR